ncbi:hypothetical protein J6590_029089 [Homalodisca vitripennis]|nr:hypothetical protein J6590_029089 [Homalodisca vitripennis]
MAITLSLEAWKRQKRARERDGERVRERAREAIQDNCVVQTKRGMRGAGPPHDWSIPRGDGAVGLAGGGWGICHNSLTPQHCTTPWKNVLLQFWSAWGIYCKSYIVLSLNSWSSFPIWRSDFRTPPMTGQAGRLQGQDRSAVTYLSSGHARHCCCIVAVEGGIIKREGRGEGRGQGRGAPHSPTAVSLHSHRRSFSLVFSCRSTCKPVNISALGYLHCDNEWFRLSFPKDSERVSPEPLERAPASVSVQCAKPAFPMTDLFRMMQNPLLGYKPLQFLGAPMLLMAGGAPSSSGSDSGSPSPPVTPGKSFTIDAILGLHNNSTNSAIDYSSRSIAGIFCALVMLMVRAFFINSAALMKETTLLMEPHNKT